MATGRAALRLVSDVQSTIHLGQSLRARREAMGLTQEQAAAEARITRGALAALEKRALPNPSLRTLLSLMRAYKLDSIEALLGSTPSAQLAAALLADGTGVG
ncbi:helix-turn-helix transcriptional regulator [Mycobacterium sp. WMMD1722]|uniref:helix-turn-helix transcriptional regulator n=1 Tax=Mycobacterium sp. WMMD1722 TaxID=3404117 RepID=UPI003BF5F91C